MAFGPAWKDTRRIKKDDQLETWEREFRAPEFHRSPLDKANGHDEQLYCHHKCAFLPRSSADPVFIDM